MISVVICTIISGVVYIALNYLTREYDVLETVAPWFGYITVGLLALGCAVAVIQMIMDIRRRGSHLVSSLICAGISVAAWLSLRLLGGTYSYLLRYETWAMYIMIGYAAAVALQLIAQIVKMVRAEVQR